LYKPEKNDTTSKIIKGLEEWVDSSTHSSRFAAFYLELLRIQAEVEQKTGVPAVGIPQKVINHRTAEGRSLARFEELDVDWMLANDTLQKLAKLFKQYSDILPNYTELQTEKIPEVNANLAQEWLEGSSLVSEAAQAGVSPHGLATLIHHTMRPFLTGYALAFKERVRQQSWRKGNCPVCGSAPSFSYLEKEAGSRYLVCSFCSMEWLFQRLDCPFCHNTDQKTLSYRTDEDDYYRLYLCEKCKRYLKAIDLRKTKGELSFGSEAIITADLDLQAQDLGYISGENYPMKTGE
jgi:FdhE protein